MSNIGYVGRQPNDTSVVIAEQQYTLLGGETQLTFSAGYDVGYVDVYKNGLRLREGAEFSATDGEVITLVTTGVVNDNYEVVAYKSFNPNESVTNIDVNFARIGIQSEGTPIGMGVTLNFLGAGNTFSVTSLDSGDIINLKLNNYADVAGIATVAEGLTGVPDIAVRNVTGAAATFTGNIISGSGDGLNAGTAWAPGFGFCNDVAGPFEDAKSIYFNYGNGGIFIGKSNNTNTQNIYLHSNGDASFSGIVTAAAFSGPAIGLTDSPNITVTDIEARHGNFSGIVTASGQFFGNLSGIATVAMGLTDRPDIFVSNVRAGILTASKGYFTLVPESEVETFTVKANTVTLGDVGSSQVGILTAVGTQDYFRIEKALFKNYGEVVYTYGNTGGTPNLDIANGNTVTATLNQNATFTFSNSNSLGSNAAYGFLLQLTNSTGGLAITWPTNVQWAGGSVPVRNSDANRTDIWSFFTTDGGTQWMGNLTISGYTL